ncbi:MAG: EcsC family protein [Atopobiaceae bacterium]|nr:EcsC family protein [Atopobiaceae bacterium]
MVGNEANKDTKQVSGIGDAFYKKAADVVAGAANSAADAVANNAAIVTSVGAGALTNAATNINTGASMVTNAASNIASAGADVVVNIAIMGAGVVANTAAIVANASVGAVKDIYSSFGGDVEIEQEGNLRDEDGAYVLPEPILDDAESNEIDLIGERWSKANAPGAIAKMSTKAYDLLPQKVRDGLSEIGDSIDGVDVYKAAMEIVAQGFTALEGHAARMSVSQTYVINRVNEGPQEQKVSSIPEICMLRSYDVARIAGNERAQHMALALTEGAATGAPGFPGIPFNIVMSLFLYFRAVQSIAMFYGYDVKADPAEMVIAGEVLTAAFGGGEQGPNGSVATGAIGKVMAISEAEVVRETVKKGWGAMASHGGVPLIIAQMRALANNAARKAVVNAGEKTLEESVFSSVFKQIGKRLTQNAVKGAVPFVSGVLGALFDTGLMNRVLNVADLFYHKRFLIEKPVRVRMLEEGITYDEAIDENALDSVEVEGIVVEMVADDAEGLTII